MTKEHTMPRIGTSELTVAPLSLGANTFGWTSSEEESLAVLDAFAAGGGDFIDTADVYSAWAPGNAGGESETIIGRWLARGGAARRDGVTIATKVAQHPQFPGLSAANVAAAADASLKRLGTDRIDLYYAHQEDPDTPVAESVAAFAALQEAGKIRAVGLSNFSAASIRAWAEAADEQGVPRPAALEPHYNLVHRADFEDNLRPTAQELGLSVMPYWGLAAGLLTGKYHSPEDIDRLGGARADTVRGYANDQAFLVVAALRDIAASHRVEPASVALAWLAAQPTVTAPIASARTVEQLPSLLASLSVELTAGELGTLDSLSAPIGH
jgi:aryl-alcohol dehydrogenase (NADP+)